MNNILNDYQIDVLTIFGTILGMLNYQENLGQTTNNELREMIDEQTLELITEIKQVQEEIKANQIKILKLLGSDSIES